MDTRQLVLLSDDGTGRDWRLDEHTRQVGRQGVAAAREALRAAITPPTDDRSEQHPDGHKPPAAA